MRSTKPGYDGKPVIIPLHALKPVLMSTYRILFGLMLTNLSQYMNITTNAEVGTNGSNALVDANIMSRKLI